MSRQHGNRHREPSGANRRMPPLAWAPGRRGRSIDEMVNEGLTPFRPQRSTLIPFRPTTR